MDDEEVAHLAGLFDGVGNIAIRIGKDESYPLNYRIRPVVTIARPEHDTATLGKLDAYTEDNAVKYSTVERDDHIEFRINEIDSIERFLEPMIPWMVSNYQASEIMLDAVIPALRNDKQHEKRGFAELAGYADELRSATGKGRKRKYTKEFFEEEWNLAT